MKYNSNVKKILASLKLPPTESEIIKTQSKKTHLPTKEVKKILKQQLKKGEKVEREHTSSGKVARAIAKHHEKESLKYYDILKKNKL